MVLVVVVAMVVLGILLLAHSATPHSSISAVSAFMPRDLCNGTQGPC
jgi:hypothetical protein